MKTWTLRLMTLVIAAAVLAACSGNKAEPAPPKAPAAKPAPAKTPAKKQDANKAAAKKAPAKKPAAKKPAPLEVGTKWDFAELEQAMWGWTFPRAGVKQTPKGAFYTRSKSAPGPIWAGDTFKADTVKGVRVEFQVMQQEADGDGVKPLTATGNPVLYWAKPEHIKGDEWPFSEERKAPLRPVNPDNPNIYEVRVDKVKDWTGDIAKVFISVPVPKELGPDETPYAIFFRKILFLK